MKCDNCGKGDAVVQWTKVVSNEMKITHLCDSCAADQGVDTSPSSTSAPLTDFLAQLGKSIGSEISTAGRCPSCGMAPSQLKQVGRLGCATCYTHFASHLRSLLRRLHGSSQHVGKAARKADAAPDTQSTRIQSLRRHLQRAVESEEFETAAAIRDQIRRLEIAE